MRNIKRMMTIVLLVCVYFMLAANTGCEYTPPPQTSYDAAAKANEEAARNVIANDTLPEINRSLDRENIKRRLEFLNQPDRIGYLYCFSRTGVLIKEVQVLGKVTSLNSYLTPMEEIKKVTYHGGGYSNNEEVITVQAPDLDGTYGENMEGVFWFNSDNIYQEWTGETFYSEERMSFSTPPLLIETIN